MFVEDWDPEAGALHVKAWRAPVPPPPKGLSRAFIGIAKLLVTATYVEDGHRLVFYWEDQSGFVAKRVGYPLGALLLFVIGFAQLSSVALLLSPTAHPALPRTLKAITVLVGLSVLMQPVVFDQMDNFDLVIFSLAQLGALGLLFCNAHSTEFPQMAESGSGALSCFVWALSSDRVPRLHWSAWVQMSSRLLLTCDLVLVFGARLFASSGPVATSTHVLITAACLLVWLGVHTHYCACAAVRHLALAHGLNRTPHDAASVCMRTPAPGPCANFPLCAYPAVRSQAFAAFADAFNRFPFWEGGRNADFHQFHFFQVRRAASSPSSPVTPRTWRPHTARSPQRRPAIVRRR